MCDITKKTDLKNITCYKVVYKTIEDDKVNYLSYFAGHPIKVGPVSPQDGTEFLKIRKRYFHYQLSDHNICFYGTSDMFWNPILIGKVSAFALEEDAMNLARENRVSVLKLELSGDIYEGTAKNICSKVPHEHVTYAGSVIDSIEEIYTSNTLNAF